jgi:N-acetylglucosamine-6-phosphate deacetylase
MDTYSDKDKEIEVQLTPSSSSSSSSLIALPKDQTLSKNNIAVNQLDIADGLKELLITHNLLSLESILKLSSDLASILGIDQHVGEIISAAAKKLQK